MHYEKAFVADTLRASTVHKTRVNIHRRLEKQPLIRSVGRARNLQWYRVTNGFMLCCFVLLFGGGECVFFPQRKVNPTLQRCSVKHNQQFVCFHMFVFAFLTPHYFRYIEKAGCDLAHLVNRAA